MDNTFSNAWNLEVKGVRARLDMRTAHTCIGVFQCFMVIVGQTNGTATFDMQCLHVRCTDFLGSPNLCFPGPTAYNPPTCVLLKILLNSPTLLWADQNLARKAETAVGHDTCLSYVP